MTRPTLIFLAGLGFRPPIDLLGAANGTERREQHSMAKSNAVWGIDIGQCSLKALRGTISDDGDGITALAYDYIEYPKILTQPEADPVVLVREALELFLSRNDVGGDSVAISVPGQSGLARFIKLPPVESKKISAIVSYEAKQQILGLNAIKLLGLLYRHKAGSYILGDELRVPEKGIPDTTSASRPYFEYVSPYDRDRVLARG